MSQPPSTQPVVRVMTVCTGNVCRSPYAAALLRSGLEWARPGRFEVSSGGTHGLVGKPMDPGSQRLLDERGVPDPQFRARLLNPAMLNAADLVLVMSSSHRSVILDEAPAMHRRVQGIRDFAQALDRLDIEQPWAERFAQVDADDVAERWRALPAVLATYRSRGAGRITEISDPYRKGPAEFAAMAEQIDPAVRTIVMWEAQFPR